VLETNGNTFEDTRAAVFKFIEALEDRLQHQMKCKFHPDNQPIGKAEDK
jgi:hypothetical protein